MDVLRLWRLGDHAIMGVRARFNEFAFALVPEREDLGGGRAA